MHATKRTVYLYLVINLTKCNAVKSFMLGIAIISDMYTKTQGCVFEFESKIDKIEKNF